MTRPSTLQLALTISIALLFTGGCDNRKDTAEAQSSEANGEVNREMTPVEELAFHHAELGFVSAVDAASMGALRSQELAAAKDEPVPADDMLREDTRQLTVFFGGNNHGEREDCGCRKNPLGGLGRRHTMLNATSSPKASEIWAGLGQAKGPVVHLDAGDGFYPNATIDRGSSNAKKIAKHDAVAVVTALNQFPPDAYLAGEIDFAFGTEELAKLKSKAKFPIISANVVDASGERILPPSVVVERDGASVGVVGVTKKETRWETYWEDRDLSVNDPLESAKAAISELPADLDLVVLLSNLGLPKTTELVKGLADGGARVDFVVVSGTNRMTTDPEFAAATPIMEPLSRGKYVGRADFILNGDTVEFRNAALVTASTLRDYRRAVRSYWSTRKQILREKQKIAELKMSLETMRQNQSADAGTSADELIRRRNDSIEAQAKRLATLEKRLEAVSSSLLNAVETVEPRESDLAGDDWVTATVVPVKVEYAEEPSTRRVLDRAARTRPQEALPRRAPGRPMKPQGERAGAN